MTVSEIALTLITVNKGFLDDVDVKKALAFEAALQSFMKDKYASLMDGIEREKDLSADGEKALSDAITEFKASAVY